MNDEPMSNQPVSEMSEAELAEYYYTHRHDPDMAGEQTVYTPPRAARVAIRLSFDEERRVRKAAQAAGMTVSAFLRQAALDAADSGRVIDIDRLRRDVNEARSRIDDARQALG